MKFNLFRWRNGFSIQQETFQMAFNSLNYLGQGFVHRFASTKATRQIGDSHAIITLRFFMNDDWITHFDLSLTTPNQLDGRYYAVHRGVNLFWDEGRLPDPVCWGV